VFDENFQCVFDVYTYSPWRSEAIFSPPLGSLLDFAFRARLYALGKRHGYP